MLFIFDYDGTLSDSMRYLHKSVCTVFARGGVKAPSLSEYILGLKPPYLAYFRERGVGIPEADIWQIFEDGANASDAALFPDSAPAVKGLAAQGHSLAVVSGNVLRRVERGLDEAGIRDRFALVYGDCENKVSALSAIVRKLGFEREDALMIGDSLLDIEHSRIAGIRSVGIIRYPELECVRSSLMAAGALGCITALAELDGLIEDRASAIA